MRYQPGTYNVLCDICAHTVKRTEARMQWDGYLACNHCWSPKKEVYSFTSTNEGRPVLNARPQVDDSFTDVTTIDSYATSNQDALISCYSGNNEEIGQSFTLTQGASLDKIQFYIRKQGTPTGDLIAKLYNSSSDIPTGNALHVFAYVDIAGLDDTTLALTDFDVRGEESSNSGDVTDADGLVNISYVPNIFLGATSYAITLQYTGGDSSNYLAVGVDESSPSHSGSYFATNTAGSSWATAAKDTIFKLVGNRPDYRVESDL